MSWSVFFKAAVVQAVSIAVLAVVLALALPRSFFESWGWLAGPAAWVACALLVARVLRLPVAGVLVGATLAGVPAVIAVLTGEHWLGTALGIPVFALWCARLARDPELPGELV